MNLTINTVNNLTINNYQAPLPSLQLVCEIPLTNSPLKAIVDTKHYSAVMNASKWYLNPSQNHVYSTRRLLKYVALHNFIMALEGKLIDGKEVDHIDRNPRNNTTANLHMVTHAENMRNKAKRKGTSSKYIGVYWSNQNGGWVSQIQDENKQYKYLGTHESEIDAAQAYDEALDTLPIDKDVKVYNFPR